MTDHHQTPPVNGRRLVAVAIGASLIGAILMLSFEYANHEPSPHHVEVRIVATPALTRRIAQSLNKGVPGGFSATRSASKSAARMAIIHQQAHGSLIVPRSGPNLILTAGADSTALQSLITQAFTATSTAMNRPVIVIDVVPLPSNDRSGLSAFVFELGLVVPSVLGSVGLYLIGLRARVWVRVSAAVLYAAAVTVLGTVVLDTIFGALTGAPGQMIAIGFLGALTFVLTVAACQAVLGLPGTGVAAVVLIFVGNAISGGTTPIPLMPDVYRQVAPWLPNNATVRAIKEEVYFNGHGVGHSVLVLATWTLASIFVLGAVDLLHQSERRARPELTAPQIYAGPGIAHLAQKASRRHAEVSAVGKHEVH